MAPAERVWDILAHQFADVARWSSIVTQSRAVAQDELPEGAVADPRAPVAARQTTSAFATLREYFTHFDDEGMVFTFATVDPPFFLKKAENTSRVVGVGDHSKVVFDVEMVLWGPFALAEGIMNRRFTGAMASVHADLKAFAEGTP